MNKLLLITLLAMLCVANTSARFLEESKVTQPEPIKNNEAEVAPLPEKAKNITEETSDKQKNDQKTTETDKKNEQVQPQEEGKKPVEGENKENKEVPIVNPEKEEQKNENKEQEQNENKNEEGAVTIEEGDKSETSTYFGLSLGFVLLLVFGVLFFFVGFYRYSLRKYKIPPFTPPNFCPNFLFPRPENDLLMEDYYISSSNNNEMGGVYSSEKYHNFY